MKLKKMLDAHRKFSNVDSLSDNLGDGYLLAHNLVYRNVREVALQIGLKFNNVRFHDYEVLPLTQLPKILEEKTIPYVPNVNALQEIEDAAPGVFQLMEAPPLRANYVCHEAAHGIARKLRLDHIGQPGGKKIAEQRELALAILLEESFANTAESLLSIYAENEIHQEFLAKNTYIFEDLPSRVRLKRAVKLIGLEATARLTLLSFLYANMLKPQVSAREFDRVLTLVLMNRPKQRFDLTKKETAELKAVFLGGFDLDPVFTIRTNGFCLRLMGIKTKLPTLFSFDFLATLETDVRYQHCLNAMAGVIASGQVE